LFHPIKHFQDLPSKELDSWKTGSSQGCWGHGLQAVCLAALLQPSCADFGLKVANQNTERLGNLLKECTSVLTLCVDLPTEISYQFSIWY